MRVLVTGGSGFLGAWIARQLIRRGHAVTTLSRTPNPQHGHGHIAADVTDKKAVVRAANHCDAIVHVAGMVSLQPVARARLFQINVEGTRNVLEAAAANRARVVQISSIATLGYTETPKLRDETSVVHVADRIRYPYADSKWQAERLALEYAMQGLDVVVVNPGYLLGPGDSGLTSTRLVLQYARGEIWLYPPGGISFADVRDVADGVVGALTHGRSGERYVLAGDNLSYAELFNRLYQLTGVRRVVAAPRAIGLLGALAAQLAGVFVPHPFQDLNLMSWQFACRFNHCDSSKARAALGYRTRDFEETLADTVRDQLARGIIRSHARGGVAKVARS